MQIEYNNLKYSQVKDIVKRIRIANCNITNEQKNTAGEPGVLSNLKI